MKKIIFLLSACFLASSLQAQFYYPTPPDVSPRLFYVQRTESPNTVVYDANIGPDGLFRKDDPINIYWIRYSENGQKVGLNYIQRTFAYGVKTMVDGTLNEYIFHLVSYSKRNFRLKKDKNGRPVVALTLNGKEAYLKRVFVELDPGFLGLKPNVLYIELFGVDARTGGLAYEKFVP